MGCLSSTTGALPNWRRTKLAPDQGCDLLEIVDDRHGRGSTIVTSQLPVEYWHDAIANPAIADVILDRFAQMRTGSH